MNMLNLPPSTALRALIACVTCLLAGAASLPAQISNVTDPRAAQPGVITGQLLDAMKGNPIVGASVNVAGTSIETVSNDQGRFRLSGVPAGTQIIKISGAGVTPARITDVAVRPGLSTNLDPFEIPVAAKDGSFEMKELVVDAGQLAKDAAMRMEAVEVTGSRIRGLLGEADFNPVISLTRTQIERAGVTSIGEISRLIPQAFSQGSYDGIGFGGQSQGQGTTSDGSTASSVSSTRSTFNLRGLGTANTLVLVNGRRIARTGTTRGNDAYDLAGIPVSLIDRVEVLTDGASAIYGSDAVGGVVNLILRKNYTGSEVMLSYENTFDTDTAVRTVTVTHSMNFDKLSLTLAGTYQDRNAFAAVDRRFVATDDWTKLGGTTGLGTGAAGSWAAGGFATGAGVVQATSGTLPGVGSNFGLIPDGATGAGLTAASFAPLTGNSFGVPAYTGDRASYVNIISPQTVKSMSFRGTYELTSTSELFLDGRYSGTVTDIEGMPVNFRNSMVVPAGYPGNPFGVPFRLNKTFWELGDIQGMKTSKTSNTAFSGGIRGSLPHDWRYEAGVDWNRGVLQDKDGYDPVLQTDVYNSLIATQSLVLVYDSRAVQPNNLDTLRSMLRPVNSVDRDISTFYSASADGPVWDLPAGPIRLAVGSEYRKEEAQTRQATPEASNINLSLLGDFERSITSAYAETRVPILSAKQEVPAVNRFDISAALRFDDYSDFGHDYSPRYGIQYRPTQWLLFRGTRSYAFRAPTLNAIYRPVTESTNANTSGFIDPVTNTPVTGVIATRIGGNPALKPEHTKSTNYGVVFEPPVPALKGLSLSVDYLDLEYTDQITQLSSLQEWANLVPDRLIRNPAGAVIMVDTRQLNISKLLVTTVDYQVSYHRSTPFGTFDLSAAATEYKKWDAIRIPGATPVTTLHQRPRRMSWQTYWSKGPYGLGVSGFYQDGMYTTAARDIYLFDSAVEWNAQVSYDFGERNGRSGSGDILRKRIIGDTRISLNIYNIFDREPPHRQGGAGFGVTDPRMARYNLTLRRTF